MAETKGQTEPSMEEILASIRRIISEDADGSKVVPAAAAPAPRPAPAPAPMAAAPMSAMADMDDEVLDLTTKLNDDGTVMDLDAFDVEPMAHDEPEPAPASPTFTLDQDFHMEEEEEPMPMNNDHNDFGHRDFSTPEAEVHDELLSAAAAAATAEAFAGLSVAGARSAPPPSRHMAVTGNTSLEELVKEVLRPVLRDWLDENLPGIVQDIVQGEVERLAQASRRR